MRHVHPHEVIMEYIHTFGQETRQPGFASEMGRRFVVLWTLLSRVPLPKGWWPKGAEFPRAADAMTMMPLVGGVLALVATFPAWLLTFAVSRAACAWIACGLYAAAGWSLHLDGWGDLWDGVGSGKRGEAMREVMKDSRSGSFGVVGIVLAISLRAALLSSIPAELWLPAVVAAGGVGRFASNTAACFGEYPWPLGMAKEYVGGFHGYQLFCAFLAACVLLPFSPLFGWAAGVLSAAFAGWALALWANRELGGANGDVLGAAAVLGELVVLMLCAM